MSSATLPPQTSASGQPDRAVDDRPLFELLDELRRRKVRLFLNEGALRFKAPKGAFSTELKAEVKARKADIVEFLHEAGRSKTPVTTIEAVGRDRDLPVSFSQERLWFFDRFEPQSALYNLLNAVVLNGPLDGPALEGAIQDLVDRHEALRTVFAEVDDRPIQKILPRVDVPLHLEYLGEDRSGEDDLSPEAFFEEEEALEQARARAAELNSLPFDLNKGPLLRAHLLRLGERRHVLVLVKHHIISDGWSIGVMIRDLAELYDARVNGRTTGLSPLAVQYPDYAVWQRGRLQGDLLKAELDHWRKRLAGAPEALTLPLDRPRPADQTSRGRTLRFRVGAELTAKLHVLAQNSGASLFMVLLAAYNGLMSRLSGQDDVVVGSPIANRNHSRTQDLIGFFVNTLALRTPLDGNPTFTELLERTRRTTLDAFEHQDLPFEKLVEELQPERDTSRSAIFQTMMVLQNAPQPSLDMGRLVLEPLLIEGDSSQFELTLTWVERDGGLDGDLEFNTDLFDEGTVLRWIGYQRRILDAVSEDPSLPLDRWPLMDDDEERRLLRWSTGPGMPDADDGVQGAADWVARHAQRNPTALALTDDSGRRLTYGELKDTVDRLAGHLLSLIGDVGTHQPEIAVCLPRGLDWVLSMLAIYRAGCVFVPLDPKAPAERQGKILSDSRPALLVTTSELAHELVESADGTALLELDRLDLDGPPETAILPRVDPSHTAYVIYTSGSTGLPKGVRVGHGALIGHMSSLVEAWGLTCQDRVLSMASFSFDVSQEQVWSALASGASLHVRGEDLYPPAELSTKLGELGITCADLPMVYWQQWVAEMKASDAPAPAALRLISIGGETMSADAARGWFRTPVADVTLINAYGPTEATVTAVSHTVPADFDAPGVPIGRPLPGRVVRILDPGGQPVPTGVVGELYLGDSLPGKAGGALLACGYGGSAQQTAERFVPDPWSSVPGGRLYRTGDYARFNAAGEVEFYGRVDEQVKIRGFRIELGEIETALLADDRLAAAAVLAWADRSLAAYGVPRDPAHPPTPEDVRAELSKRVPEYMVPASFVLLDVLPTTLTGKLDKKALPEPTFEAKAGISPRNEMEHLLADVWAQTLGLDRDAVSIDAGFFELGGHSLLATQLVSRIGRAVDLELPLKVLFESPTLRGLAREVERLKTSGAASARPELVRADRDRPLPLSFSQERLWLFEQLVPGTSIYNTSRAGRLIGELNTEAVERAIGEVMRRHESLRTRYVAVPGQDPVQLVDPFEPRPLDVVDLSHLPQPKRSAEAERLAQEESDTPFDFAEPVGLRCRLLRLSEREHVVLMSIHHIAYDLASGGILLYELETLYRAFAAGEPSPLPDLELHYPDFAAWQRSWLKEETLADQLAYWRSQLAPVADPADTPRIQFADRNAAGEESYAGALYRFFIAGDLGARATRMAQDRQVTQFMLHLSAFMALLYRYAPQPHLLVGTAISNRSSAEMEDVIGFFDNLLPLVAEWHDGLTFNQAIDQIRSVALGAYANQHVPFEMLVREVRPQRDAGRIPLLQIIFLYLLDYPAMSRDIAGLEMEPYHLDVESAKFDLTLALRDTPEGMVGQIEYNTGLFEKTTIERLARHYEVLLGAALEHPDRPLVELPLLTEEEHRQLDRWTVMPALTGLPSTVETHRSEVGLSVPERIARRAAEQPDAPAIGGAGSTLMLTYGELQERAERLAHRLRRAGVGPEDRVLVCSSRCPGHVVALYAIWLAGAAYLPVDPDYPKDRIAFLLEDSGASVALVDAKTVHLLPKSQTVIWQIRDDGTIDDTNDASANADDTRPTASDRSLAYVIYTSGSTGRPKGVQIEHGSLARLVDWYVRRCGVTADTVSSHLAGQGFDASVWEIWPVLAVGGRLELVADATRKDPEALAAWLRDRRVDVAFLPTPLAEALLDVQPAAEDDGTHPSIVLTGGDRLRRRPDRSTPFELLNNYGPTESTVLATSCVVPPGSDADTGAPSIGSAIPSIALHVLDRGMRPVPVGCPGELYLGGDQLARGYWGRAGLTAERFVPDPFAGNGRRLYRTGDLVRRAADGSLYFLGRLDEQVKIRGFRVELGEIEAALTSLASVNAAAVVAPEARGGERRLLAFVEPRRDAPKNLGEILEETLGNSLPDYMVPSRFENVKALPITANGKVDRRSLERRGAKLLQQEIAEIVTPRTAMEEAVVEMWAELLDRPRPSIDDDFFSLGGHSLLATRLISRARQDFGVELPMEVVFNHPTPAGFAAAVEVQQALSAVGPDGDSIATMDLLRIDRGGPLPLSSAQERIWFLDRLRPGDPAYTIPAAVRLLGPLDVEALRRAAQGLIDRHESLRTVFSPAEPGSDDGVFATIRGSGEPVDFQLFESSDEPSDEASLRRELADQVADPFDLATGPLLRLRLWALADDHHVFLWTVHHIVADGWSMGVFLQELAALYSKELDPRLPPLPALGLQYVDFAAAQRDWLGSGAGQARLAYWRDRLTDVRPTELPTSQPPSPDASGAIHRQRLDAETSQRLKELARREGASLFMAVAAAMAGLLRRLHEQDHVVFGYPAAGRRRAELEGLIGMFLNTLVLRIDVGDGPSFRELLRRSRQGVLEGDAHQDVPFETLLEELRPERDLHRTPLFQVMINMLSFPDPPKRLGRLDLEPLTLDEDTAKFDLTLYASEDDGRLKLDWVYRTARFEPRRVALLAELLGRFIADAVSEPERPLITLPMGRPRPRDRVELAGAVGSRTVASRPVEILARVLDHARRQPERPALKHVLSDADDAEPWMWTYGRLEQRSAELARALIANGVEKGDVVAVYAARNAALVPALLGIWRAGAAFAVLDSAYPTTRSARQVKVAGSVGWVVLESAGTAPELVLDDWAFEPRFTIEMPSDPSASWALSDSTPGLDLESRQPEANDLAYVAFTSGSTGEPRAVEGTFAPLDHFLAWHTKTFELRPEDRFAMLSGLAHDPLLRDIFTPLYLGAGLHVPPAVSIRIPRELRNWLRDEEISVIHGTPSLIRLLAEDRRPKSEGLFELRRVFAGGETLTFRDAASLRDLAPGARLVNFYGATETPQGVAYFEVEEPTDGARRELGPVPVGRGIDGVELLVLDQDGRPAPDLARGQIAVRTPYLSRGYRGDRQATAERFVELDGVTTYLTGDLGRREPDGSVVFLGRRDRQVTVRGYRVECGEVERILTEHPAVSEAVVQRRPTDGGLAAWWVGDAELDEQALRTHAAARLPAYAVPGAWKRLEAIPLTPNGKVDLRALPSPTAIAAGQFRAPETELQRTLAGLWQELLGVERVGLDDHFFELGGHSLTATRLASRIQAAIGIDMPLAAFFEAPTLEGLAREMAAAAESALGSSAPGSSGRPAEPGPRPLRRKPGQSLPLSFAQERLWFLDRFQPDSTAFVLSAAFEARGDLDEGAFERALDALVARHEVLRTRFEEVDGKPRACVDGAARVHLERRDVRPEADPEAAADRIMAEIRPMSLDRAPLMRARLLHLGDGVRRLSLELHHIVTDGWSMALLVGELGELYAAEMTGRQARLPELMVQYADVAAWQRRTLQGERLRAELDGWSRRLEGLPPSLELPTDLPRPQTLDDRGARLHLELPAALVERLKSLTLERGTTLFTALAAALQALLARHSGQRDLAIGLPVAGRRFQATEPLIGLFVNTLVLRGDLSGDSDFERLLGRVHSAALDAQAHGDVPFEKLVAELQPERSLAHAPLFQVMLAFQNMPRGSVELPGLTLKPLDSGHASTPLDLSLELMEDGGRIVGSWTYNVQLFEEPTVRRLMDGFRRMLEAMVEQPQGSWLDVPLMSDDTAGEELRLSTGRTLDRPPLALDQPLGFAFFELAAAEPRRPAIIGRRLGEERTKWTYGELAGRAVAVSRELQSRGLEPEQLVGVAMERGPEMVAALLGILHAGGAYLPLDPSYPVSRLTHMLDDACGPDPDRRWILTRSLDRAELPDLDGVLIDVDGLPDAPSALPVEPMTAIDGERLAYVIYTSGSTGKPKGVQIRHRSVVSFLASMAEEPGLDADDVLAAVTTLSFDISVLEIFLPLSRGARVVMVDRAGVADGAALGQALEEEEVTVLQATPAGWRLLLESGWAGRTRLGAPQLKALCGGEALPPDLADALAGRCRSLWNLYGPTETTVWSSAREVAAGERPVRVGGPIAHTTLHLLDERLTPVPPGVAGEVYLGGRGLARGYRNRPALTAERFLPDPFSDQPGARLYRVGDLARRRTDGTLEFLGRTDHQVKVRGYRIELGEIEAVLSRHPDVSQAAAVARHDQLIAYPVFLELPDSEALDTLRAWAKAELPAHMVPHRWLPMDRLPLTPSGKVDRRALPDPNAELEPRAGEAPRGGLETALAELWREVLGIDTIYREDDFFALGGHSLAVVRLLAAVRKRLSREMAVQALFLHPTLAQMAERLATPTTADDRALVPLNRAAGRDPSTWSEAPLFCVHAVGGDVGSYAQLARDLEPRPVFGLQAVGAPPDDLESMARQYLEEIRGLALNEPLDLLGWSMGGVVAFEMARQERDDGRLPVGLTLLDAPSPAAADPLPGEISERDLLTFFAAELGPILGIHFDRLPESLLDGKIDDGTEILRSPEVEQLLPEGTDTDELAALYARYRSRFRAHRRLLADYRPAAESVAVGKATVFYAQESDRRESNGPAWKTLLPESQPVELPGDHFSMLQNLPGIPNQILNPEGVA